ncbi:MAG TPA: ATP-binding protein [Polyangiaceae bacterium]|nr:ATP-binding protein [Polyangiaceae bacterium]
MRLTVRRKLMAVAGIAALAFLFGVISNVLIAQSVGRQLTTIRERYVPRVELEPQLYGQFERISRGFQDAVAARDLDALATPRELKGKFEAQLDGARGALNPSDVAALRRALQDYYLTADSVSRRLIAEETGEDLVDAIAAMKLKHTRLSEELKRTTRFERRDLDEAFTSAARAVSSGSTYQLYISVGFLVLVAVLLIATHRDLLRSLAELTAGFQRFGKGVFEPPIEVRQRDELGELAEHANHMAESLARVQGQLLRAQEKLEVKVEERTRELSAANEAIRQMNNELERHVGQRTAQLQVANRELESFSYSVAHDLRAPLRGVSGFAEVLLADYEDKLDEEGKDCLREILENAQRMSELIDALLSLSRVTRTELRTATVELSALAHDVVKRLAAADPRPGYELVVAESVQAEMDPQFARAILENLLGNAWKFTSHVALPRLEFGVTETNGERTFFVRDNGAGFNQAYAEKMFAPFQRLHTVAEFPGTGIGLATVQRIVHRHGGRIWAEGHVGQGAAFYFTLREGAGEATT